MTVLPADELVHALEGVGKHEKVLRPCGSTTQVLWSKRQWSSKLASPRPHYRSPYQEFLRRCLVGKAGDAVN